ncbi:MAG: alkaline phosphatase D family protein, partial [Planctomycetes bacterium]|nr:alkaline phosphatase D family protein [Planctomycetota bacterium]
MIPAQQAASIAALTLFVATAAAQTQTHGQIVGEVGSDSAVVWTRASQPCLVSVLYDTNPTFATAVETPLYGAGAARDNTVRVLLTGLASDRLYYYRLRLRLQSSSPGNLGPIGRFRTAPLASQSAPISFAFSGDVQTLSEYGIFTSVAAANPAFFVMLGDFPYCDGAVTVSDYWLEHATHRASAAFQAFTNQVPVLAVWDDHEVVNNWDGATSQMLVAAGTQAFRDWWPLPNGPTDIWRQRRYGKELELFLIDTRRYRGRNDDPPSAQKPLLGATQLAWLEQALQQSDATWKVIATSVPTFYNGTDSWDGYVHEREQLLAFLRQQHVDNVVFVAA